MALIDDIVDDLDGVFFDTDEWSEPVTYTPNGGNGITINAVLNKGLPNQEAYVRGVNFAGAEITVKASDVTAPQWGDTFTIGGETWELDPAEGVIHEDDYTLTMILRRVESV